MNAMRYIWFYALVGAFFIGMLVISFRFFRGSGETAIGLARSKEYKISSAYTAVVSRVSVVPGMEVKEGDVLLELTSPELEMEVSKLSSRVRLLETEKEEKKKLAHAEAARARTEMQIQLDGVEADLAELQAEIRLNTQITGQSATPDSASPQAIKLNALQQQRERLREALDLELQNISQRAAIDQKMLENQIAMLQHELSLLGQERMQMRKLASVPGVVENVFVKAGEQADAFSPLVEIIPRHPTTVVAYLVGKQAETFPIGSRVTVISNHGQRVEVAGTVSGYGSVTQLPEILQKATAVKAFGQEVFIEIPAENSLANGEKVLIR